jgi:hypothetical protein
VNADLWRIDSARTDDGTVQWSRLSASDGSLTVGEVAQAWRSDATFRQFWIDALRRVPFDAYCWECPPITAETLNRQFECAFVSSPSLAEMPLDAESFAEHFRSDREVVTFRNLGGDAVLVAPCPDPSGGNFAHLARFTATARPALQQALWKEVGTALEARVGSKPLWLNTAGHGVAWLHVRLDSSPKYYQHGPYKSV